MQRQAMRALTVLSFPLLFACQDDDQLWKVPHSTIKPPLPEVRRASGNQPTVFHRPSIVLIAQIRERRLIEKRDEHGGSLDPPRAYSAIVGETMAVVRVNERQKGDPDLGQLYFVVDQVERGERPLELQFGRLYLLLLNPWPAGRGSAAPGKLDSYVFAVRQGGYEIRQGRLVVLERGGELDEYDGRSVDEVLNILK